MVTSSNPRTVSSSWVIELILECVAIRDPEFTLAATELQYISYMEIYHGNLGRTHLSTNLVSSTMYDKFQSDLPSLLRTKEESSTALIVEALAAELAASSKTPQSGMQREVSCSLLGCKLGNEGADPEPKPLKYLGSIRTAC